MRGSEDLKIFGRCHDEYSDRLLTGVYYVARHIGSLRSEHYSWDVHASQGCNIARRGNPTDDLGSAECGKIVVLLKAKGEQPWPGNMSTAENFLLRANAPSQYLPIVKRNSSRWLCNME
jgi:hypothetical protein